MNKYTIQQFQTDFPNEDVCLDYIFKKKYPNLQGYYRVRKRKCYADSHGKQIHPLKGTIFEKSDTKLTLWLYAIYLFSASKNGVSAKELQRQLGVTYKTAWRMAHQIRRLMTQDSTPLTGIVEIDETYYGKKERNKYKFKSKDALLGMVERDGKIRVKKVPNRRVEVILPIIKKSVEKGTHIVTDEYHGYRRLTNPSYEFKHSEVKHGRNHFSWKGQNTNTIEGFWGQFKRSVRGTYHFVSSQHLQSYADEFAFRYSHRTSPIFESLVARI